MIVLTIVVSMMAIAWPRMRGLAAKSQLREAAVEFKSACAEARDLAVRSGRPVYLRYQFGQSPFRLSDSAVSEANTVDRIQIGSSGNPESESIDQTQFTRQFELSLGIVFDDPANQRDETETDDIRLLIDPQKLDDEDKLTVGKEQTIDWTDSESITFFSEGRATAATVLLLADDSGDSIMLTVRGLTGGVSIGPVERPFDPEDRDGSEERDGESPPATTNAVNQEVGYERR